MVEEIEIFRELKPRGFIDNLKTAILNDIPTSPKWAEAIAMTVQATVLSKMKISTRIGPLPLNVWHLMIGPSGLAYKTTPFKYFVYPILVEVSKLINKPIIMPSKYSVEGMIEYLAQRHSKGRRAGEQKHNEGIIVRDEFTSLFKGVYHKGYLADEIEFMSELYDGTMQKRYTRKAKLEHAVDVYICLLSATTPYLFSVMKRDFFIQGTGNRMLFIMHEPTKPPKYKEGEFFIDAERQREKTGRLLEFANILSYLYQSKIRYIFPYPEVENIWLRYRYEKMMEATQRYEENPQDILYSYLQRMPEMALKIAGLSAVSKSAYTIADIVSKNREEIDTLMIGKDDFNYAIMKTDEYFNDFLLMLDKWGMTPERKPAQSEEADIRYLLGFIATSPDGLLTQREWLKQSFWTKGNRWYRFISTLVTRGEIRPLTDEEVQRLITEPEFRELAKKHGLLPYRGGQLQKVYILNRPKYVKKYTVT